MIWLSPLAVVAKVYAELERANVVATQRGVGTFVRDPVPSPARVAKQQRDRELEPLVDRLLADASVAGITMPEIIQYLETLQARHSKERA